MASTEALRVASNYDDVLDQLRGFGLQVQSLEVGRIVRCFVEDDKREKRGWYALHEVTLDDGERVLVGSYGVWHGNENNAQRIKIGARSSLTSEQRKAITARIAADKRREKARRLARAKRAAEKAARAWRSFSTEGDCEYLARKKVQAHGARFTDKGALVIPMMDPQSRVHGLQFILPKGHPRRDKIHRDKEYWPAGLVKQGHYFAIGALRDGAVCLVAEGFATAATLHETTGGITTVVAFDANNLLPVCQALRKRWPRLRILVCADDDYLTDGNPGTTAARNAALAVDGEWIAPVFETDREGKKLTDFNDLAALDGPHRVESQLLGRLDALGWGAEPAAAPARVARQGEGGSDAADLRPIDTVDELLERFALVYGQRQTVFDEWERCLVSLGDIRDACVNSDLVRRWQETPERRIVRIRNVGFDPACSDPEITCNLWGGWPTTPKSGSCEKLLGLLEFLCSTEKNSRDLFDWVVKWLAYPIQHPGAKMKTALALHGSQGVGKNLFFESYAKIYGEYARVVDQAAIEDKFNDWASKKLFLVADEVVARAELFHQKNKLKGLITGDTIRINPKNVTAYEERNHCNLVFLSNETQPLILEQDDRRYTVIWTPTKWDPGQYRDIADEIRAGGIEALHHYLLNVDLGDFNEHTKPPMTQAKADLIDLGMDSAQRFWRDLHAGDIGEVEAQPVPSQELYNLYRQWTQAIGYPYSANQAKFSAELTKRANWRKVRARYVDGATTKMSILLIPSWLECPPNETQAEWLGRCVQRFRQQFNDWRQGGRQTVEDDAF